MARPSEPFEIGVMFWATPEDNPDDVLRRLMALGLRSGQLGVPGDLDLRRATPWHDALEAAVFAIYTVFAAFEGESYADIPAVQRTVGFIPPSTREARERRMFAVSDFAREIGVPSIAAHVGFVPEDSGHADYIAVREIVRRVCDRAAEHGQTVALETGQERAEVLLAFLHDVNRDNLGINFDPANLILYGAGEPLAALDLLAAHVLSVHCKDGDRPPADNANALGCERPLGQGEVGMERFLRRLRQIGYRGPLTIERETNDAGEWIRDIEAAIRLLKPLTA